MPYLLSQLGYATGKSSSGQYTRLGTDCGGSASYTRLYNDFYINSFFLTTSDSTPDENTSSTYVYANVGGGSKVSRIISQSKHYGFFEASNGSFFSLTNYGSYVRVNTSEVSSNTSIQIGCTFNDGFSYSNTDYESLTIQETTPPISVDYTVVAGGGGGGMHSEYGGGGGGGAGGFRYGTLNLTPGTYSISVGTGGASYNGNLSSNRSGANGSSSTFHTITSSGGGGGGSFNYVAGGSGGSGGGSGGGGSSGQYRGGPGSGVSGQGNSGGDAQGTYNIGAAFNYYAGGGGGGGGGAGGYGSAASPGHGGASAFHPGTGQYYSSGGPAGTEPNSTGGHASNPGEPGSGAGSCSYNLARFSGSPNSPGRSGVVILNLNGASFSVSGLSYSQSGSTLTFTSGSGTITIS
jgi:hypothetical protein